MANDLSNKDLLRDVMSIASKVKDLATKENAQKVLDRYIPAGKVTLMAASCFRELSEVTREMNSIQQQDGWDSYWNKAENIRTLANAVKKSNIVTQKILNLTLLLMSGIINLKQDYNTIISYFDKANEQYAKQLEVIEIIGNMKNVLSELMKKQLEIDELKEGQKAQSIMIDKLASMLHSKS